MLLDIWLPNFDIYEGKADPKYFKSHRNSWCPDFFQKNILMSDLKFTSSDITSFLPDNLDLNTNIYTYISIHIFRPVILPSRCSMHTCSSSCTILWSTRPSTSNFFVFHIIPNSSDNMWFYKRIPLIVNQSFPSIVAIHCIFIALNLRAQFDPYSWIKDKLERLEWLSWDFKPVVVTVIHR